MIWENRWHPLLERWVTITSHRGARPWQGAYASETSAGLSHDPSCYLCPRGLRVSGAKNPDYAEVFVFDNDHPAFDHNAPEPLPVGGVYQSAKANGICRVMCYTPDHAGRLSELSSAGMQAVINVWRDQTEELMQRDDIEQVFIFENNGEIVGVSNPHPHCQIYGVPFVFPSTKQIASAVSRYRTRQHADLFAAIVAEEEQDGRRLLTKNADWVAFVPYFAQLPYETWIVPRQPIATLSGASAASLAHLGQVLSQVLKMQDRLWASPQSYILSLHQAPKPYVGNHDFRFFLQIQPMLRGPGLQKYLAGIETAAGHFLNDGSPEEKAAELKATGRA